MLVELILTRPFHRIDHEHLDYSFLRLHAKAGLLEYVEQGPAVGITDSGVTRCGTMFGADWTKFEIQSAGKKR